MDARRICPSFLLLLQALCLQLITAVKVEQLSNIYWNNTSPVFDTEYQKETQFVVKLRDRINIHCPYYTLEQNVAPSSVEYNTIYMVSDYEYEHCILDKTAKAVGQCRSPYKPTVITVVIREFTPNPAGLEFTPGGRYYFISTSDGSYRGINSHNGGLCKSHNRKISFDVDPVVKVEDLSNFLLPQRRTTVASPEDLNVDGDILPPFWSPTYQFVDRPLSDGLQKSKINGEIQPQLVLYEIEEVSDSEASRSNRPFNSASTRHWWWSLAPLCCCIIGLLR